MTQAEQDIHFMTIALRNAKEAWRAGETVPVGALVVSEHEIVGTSGNPSRLRNSRLDHAEVWALADASPKIDLWSSAVTKGITLYTTLEPCIMCFGTILHCRIGRIVYALEDPYGGACSISEAELPLRHRGYYPIITMGISRKEAKELLREYFLMTERTIWQNSDNPLVKLCIS